MSDFICPLDYRYGRKEMKDIFSEESRIKKQMLVEAALARAHAELNEITKEENTPNPYESYSMEGILLDVYTTITCMLYESAFEGNTNEAKSFAAQSIQHGCPANLAELKIVSREWDKDANEWVHKISTESAEYIFSDKRPVLSSIKSDQVVLNAISRIIGTSFATNQYFTPMVEMNHYDDAPIVMATQEK